MNINISWPPSKAELNAAGRHVITFTSGVAVTFAGFAALGVSMHLFTGADATSIGGALNDIASGVKTVVSGLTTIAGGVSVLATFAMAYFAARSANPTEQAKSIVTSMPGTQIVGPASLAEATPGYSSIVSNEKNTVVSTGDAKP